MSLAPLAMWLVLFTDNSQISSPAGLSPVKVSAAENPQAEKPQAAPAADELALLPIEAHILKYTNAERARRKLPPLVVDARLQKTARAHAAWMARQQTMRHTRRPVAENIAMGQRTSREAVRSWMNSPGHRANILSRGSRKIGIAAYRAADGAIYWCQQFLR